MNSNLDFGGKTGLYSDTITALINYSLHNLALSQVVLIITKIIFTSIILIPFSIIVLKIIKRDLNFFSNFKGLIIVNFLITILFIAIVLEHIIIKADYPISRFSLFILPIFFVHLGFFLSYLTGFYKKQSIS
ncbi:MAG: hypothetical protein QM534_12890 [Sediminibacterium sp.]|nr:hypothetical protein [Sediminibacterium sp.]